MTVVAHRRRTRTDRPPDTFQGSLLTDPDLIPQPHLDRLADGRGRQRFAPGRPARLIGYNKLQLGALGGAGINPIGTGVPGRDRLNAQQSWLGREDSNLRWRNQNPLPYPLATPHPATRA
jgi:hypothetical protein